MRYPRLLCVFSMFFFVGISVTVLNSANVKAGEEWTASFEAFKPTDDPKYHQRNTGGIQWGLFQEQPNEDTKTGKPHHTDIYWIQGEKGWVNRIKQAEGQSRLKYLTPANVQESKYHGPCPLCAKPTYFWLDNSHIDGDTEKLIRPIIPVGIRETEFAATVLNHMLSNPANGMMVIWHLLQTNT